MTRETEPSYDVVVVGCGMAGLAAALAASENGASVAVLEKSPKRHRGGQTRFTESFRITTADIDLEGYEFHVDDYSAADFYSDLMKVTNFQADERLAKTLTSETASTFEWLTSWGFEWELQAPHSGYTAGRVWIDGEEFVSQFLDILDAEGVDVFYNAQARRLEHDDHRTVTGVEVFIDDDLVRFESAAVVLASGGYESNKEKRVRYYGPGYESMKVRGSRYNTGEAIDMAIDIGAKAEGEWSGAHMALIDASSPDVEGGITRVDGYQYGIILNHDGKRFVDEGEDSRAHTYAKLGKIIFEQPYHEAFIVVDGVGDEHIAHMGRSRPVTADSIEQLVRRADINDAEQAVRTVEEFNLACDPGEFDPQRLDGNATAGLALPKSNWAIPIAEPPFTAYPVTGGITFAFGGLGVNPEAEVLDTTDRVMRGLYAAGNSTGGLFYNNYPGGTGLTNAAVFGRIAGTNAAGYARS